MWIFGYGSLVWKVDFPYVKKVIGYIKGYDRKFWQQSIDHRGVPEKPGRVVTLVPSSDPEAKVWGAAYKIHRVDIERVLQHLDHREIMGYEKVPIMFHPITNHPQNILEPPSPLDYGNDHHHLVQSVRLVRLVLKSDPQACDTPPSSGKVESAYDSGTEEENQSSSPALNQETEIISVLHKDFSRHHADSDNESDNLEEISRGLPFTVTMYYGSEKNEHYIGPNSLEAMAKQIFEAVGPSGKNKDYIFNLATAMHQISEEAVDSHLAELETLVRDLDTQFNLHTPSTPMEL